MEEVNATPLTGDPKQIERDIYAHNVAFKSGIVMLTLAVGTAAALVIANVMKHLQYNQMIYGLSPTGGAIIALTGGSIYNAKRESNLKTELFEAQLVQLNTKTEDSEADTSNEQIEALQQQIQEKESTLETALKEKTEAHQKQIEELEKTHNVAIEKLNTEKSQLKKENQNIESLQTEKESLTQQLNEQTTAHGAALKEKTEAHNKQIKELEKTHEVAIQKLTTEKSKLKEENQTLKKQNEELSKQNHELNKRMEKARTYFQTQQNEKKQLVEQLQNNAELPQKLEATTQKVLAKEQVIETLTESNQQLQAQINANQEKHTQVQTKLSTESEELKKKIGELEQKLKEQTTQETTTSSPDVTVNHTSTDEFYSDPNSFL